MTKSWYDFTVATAHSRLAVERADFFGTYLKSRDRWRLFETIRHRMFYLDIETTGPSAREGLVTVVCYAARTREHPRRHEPLSDRMIARCGPPPVVPGSRTLGFDDAVLP